MFELKVNLACGSSFLEDPDWVNVDYTPSSPKVRQMDLLGRLPFEDGSVAVVYSSHFLEHIPRTQVRGFLQECFRILKPGGSIRLALPDFEEMCREYVARRECGEHEKADFVVVEIIDQCVRLSAGGELRRVYEHLARDPERHAEMIKYVRFRNGETLRLDRRDGHVGLSRKVTERSPSAVGFATKMEELRQRALRRIQRLWFSWLIDQLPSAFRAQNVSLARVGERHHWLWDFYQLFDALADCGYVHIEKRQAANSGIPDFPVFPLDVDERGDPRKGAESMYVEAAKPRRDAQLAAVH